MRGTVANYNRASGYGFIIPMDPNDPDAPNHFVHYSAIQANAAKRFLRVGQIVEFETEQDEHGRFRAVKVRKLPSEDAAAPVKGNSHE